MFAAFMTDFQDLIATVTKANDSDWSHLDLIGEWRRKHFIKIAKLFDSFVTVLLNTQDYNTACSIIRMIYDNWYSYVFIYCFSEGEERLLRYYLYVIDGINQRKETMQNLHEGEEIEPEIKKIADDTIRKCEEAKLQYVDLIHQLSLYPKHSAFIDRFVEKGWWQYKSLTGKKPSSYQWNELYEKLSGKDTKAFMGFLSQYVHGLYLSSLTIVPSNEEMGFVFHEALRLVKSINIHLKEEPLVTGGNA